MDRGKAKGDFSTAYKLSRSTKDTKQRLNRRSLEWKEIRRDLVDKRRNINTDLSPVLEGDQLQQGQDKHYKGKTPTKHTNTAAGSATKLNDRMDMLKKWKAEREQKKKEEQMNKKATVFRVSKNIEHKDVMLFKKSQPVKNQVKMNVAQAKHISTKHPEPVNKASQKSDTKPHPVMDKPQGRAPQPHGTLKGLGKTAMLKKPHSPKAAAVPSTKGKSTKESSQVAGKNKDIPSHAKTVKQPSATTRVSRSQTKSHVVETTTKPVQGKTKGKVTKLEKVKTPDKITKPEKTRCQVKTTTENTATEPAPPVVSDHSVSMSKVTMRGSASEVTDSFAPSDCTFSAPANVSSFVFKPLSPASAAVFLFPNQDTSSSFLETKPNRASTPKSADKETENSDQTAATMINTATQELQSEQTEEKEKMSPVKTRRSSRRSVGLTCDSSSENEMIVKPTSATPARSNRCTRASVLATVSESEMSSETDVTETEKNIIETPSQSVKRPRRSLRRSVITNSITEKTESSEEEIGSPAKRRRSSRRSLVSSEDQRDQNSGSSEEGETETLESSLRRSTRKSKVCQETEEQMDVEETVGSKEDSRLGLSAKSRRRSVRKSSFTQRSVEEVNDTDKNENRPVGIDDKKTVSTPDATEIGSEKEVCSVKRITRAKFLNNSTTAGNKENKTPARQKGRAGRRSFAGFALPDSNSSVLSAKRKARKSMMPKSPEEWVDLLSHSPMVEMTRRTPKSSASKSCNESIPPLNFDDVDLDNLSPASAAQPEPVSLISTQGAEVPSSNLTEPLGALSLSVGESPARARRTTARSPAASPRSVSDGVTSFSNGAISPLSGARQTRSASSGAPSPVTASSDVQSTESVAKKTEETLQVEEISSTLDEHLSDELVGIRYFRNLLSSEGERLRGMCSLWEDYNESTKDIAEEDRGQIRTVIGQAVLLMKERFKQFSGLVDNCEFKTGEKETMVSDLQGFWDMIYFQVEDVTAKFDRLEKLRKNNWVEDKPKPAVKKVVKKKAVKPAGPNLNVKSKFAAFRAQMKKQQQAPPGSPVLQKEEEKVFEVPGFFKVASPVRSPKPHCAAGTPKKAQAVTEDTSNTENSEKASLKVPIDQSAGNELLNRTPARKSYVPVIPSPLLQDTTPVPRPVRSCTKKTPIPKRLLDNPDSADTENNIPEPTELEADTDMGRKTPKRRSLRARKSVTFNEHVDSAMNEPEVATTIDSPVCESSDVEFARLLQPIAARQESPVTKSFDDSFSKYLQPSKDYNTAIEKENTPKQGRKRRPSLKTTKSSEKRRSRGQNVHFVSPLTEHETSQILPHTPYNRNSLVKAKRVTRSSTSSASKLDVFDIENIDDDENMPTPLGNSSRRSARPSLLYTPPDRQTVTSATKNIPTATLISFSP